MLSQTDAEGCDHPVAYFSRKSHAQGTKYATFEKECLIIKLGFEAFQVYIQGNKFTIKADHRAL